MAEETKKTAAPEAAACAAEEVPVTDVPVAEKPTAPEKDVPPQPEPEPEPEKVAAPAEEKEKDEAATADEKIAESASFKEESNKVDDLVDPEKKALDEFKLLIQEALNKHEFTAPPPPPPAKEEEKKEEAEAKPEEKKEAEKEETKTEEEPKIESCEAPPAEIPPPKPATEEPAVEKKVEEATPPPCEEKSEAAEEIKETIVHEVTAPTPPPCEEPATAPAAEEPAPPQAPEEVSIWGVPLLADERSDLILLKFLRARDFKVKEAFTMLKNVVAWRKEFKIDSLLEEEESAIVEGLEKVVYLHGVDKEGHPICYNAFGAFQDKELYNNTFGDAEKRSKFLRWYILLLEKNIRKFDFSPDSICTIVQITDLKNLPGLILFKKDFRQATNEALQLLQDNYPEFVAKQVFINVPWWYVAYNRLISPFLTQRTKSKFVFAGPTKTAETLFKYIAPEQVPVQYGGLSKEGETEFTTADSAIEETIKPTGKHTVELPITEACTLIWEVRVVGWEICYGAEFVPSVEGGYTWIVHKSRKIGPGDEQVVGCSFKIGETGKVVLTFDNQTSKKKKLLYRFKTKPSE
ncbi:patellin-3-like [Salvia miltiorrhiza]|uniref:patellin-3-like n=1 Tax=Salvia miltiorrhiza TaxID=226208 RepID=UPI0025AD0FC3|nr:patellin-3-like [Salvia miltiorrhiza]